MTIKIILDLSNITYAFYLSLWTFLNLFYSYCWYSNSSPQASFLPSVLLCSYRLLQKCQIWATCKPTAKPSKINVTPNPLNLFQTLCGYSKKTKGKSQAEFCYTVHHQISLPNNARSSPFSLLSAFWFLLFSTLAIKS